MEAEEEEEDRGGAGGEGSGSRVESGHGRASIGDRALRRAPWAHVPGGLSFQRFCLPGIGMKQEVCHRHEPGELAEAEISGWT